MRYPCHIRREGGTVIATFRDVPEAITEGCNADDAMAMAADALAVALLGRMKDGIPVLPASPPYPGERLVAVADDT